MYTIKCSESYVFDSTIAGLGFEEPVLTQEVNKAGELTFKLPATHAHYIAFSPLITLLRIYRSDALVFKARVVDERIDHYKTKTIVCEGALAFLNDSQIRPFDFSGSLADFFESIIAAHNSQVKPFQRFNVGMVTVSDDYVHYSSSEYLSAWEVIRSCLVDTHGGYVRVRFNANEDSIIDYVEDFTDATVHVVRQGENIISLNQIRNAATTYTAIVPLGAKVEETSESGEVSEHRITIESVNNGVDYLINERLAALYGVVYAPTADTTWDNVTEPANLLNRGQAYLENIAIKLRNTLEIDAEKLEEAGSDDSNRIPFIGFCDKVNVISIPHGIDRTFLISKITIPLHKPYEARLTLGDERYSMLTSSIDWHRRLKRIEKDYVTQAWVASKIPTVNIAANTAARHTHSNNAILDNITGIVTADKINDPDHPTDVVNYEAFQVAIKDKFAPATHNHTASDINSGTLPIVRGGTGKTTALSASKALGRGYGTCLTSSATAAKVVALADFTRVIGAMVAVKFTYANTADNPTLNVNRTGAATIYNCYTNAAIVSGNITANMTAWFVFNGSQWVLMNPTAQLSKV